MNDHDEIDMTTSYGTTQRIVEEKRESSKQAAVNVTQEAADVYYESVQNLPKDLREKVSCYMLAEIFRAMVVPAIDHARFIDRHGYSNRSQEYASISEVIDSLSGGTIKG